MVGTWGGIEAGGTKCVVAVGSGPEKLQTEKSFPTTTPTETLSRIVQFLQEQTRHTPLTALGIASFGPLDPRETSPTYGYITTTPKTGWAFFNFAGFIKQKLGVPIAFDTDVNGAALAEYRWGAARQVQNFIYLTVGTGIGGGGMLGGQLIQGSTHPEMGHLPVPHDRQLDPFPGSCPYHGDCLEGLASGPALEQRWGVTPATLPPDHPAWDLEAQYLALALVTYIYTLSPQRIILAGGVMTQEQLFPLIRRNVQQLLNDYLLSSEILSDDEQFIVPPALGKKAGVLGAIALAQQKYESVSLS